MFDLLLYNLRATGMVVGMEEWMVFLKAIRKELIVDTDSLYSVGRAILVPTEARFDDWDVAYKATFDGVELDPEAKKQLLEWLANAVRVDGAKIPLDLSPEEIERLFRERLKQQKERHDGGDRWIGTGGTSPFGNSGLSQGGIQVGGGGGRSAMRVAGDRGWQSYRTDRTLEVRDLQVALKALRKLMREGQWELALDKTIRKTADNAGEIEFIYQRARRNRIHLVLIMDTGGSMAPHTRLVERLFTAAQETKGFKSFEAWFCHNAPYGYLYSDYDTYDRMTITDLLARWSPQHRIVWVGDASMAPHELFASSGGWAWRGAGSGRGGGMSGLAWMQAIQKRCPSSVWLNPDPERWWNHPTVQAIGQIYPMYPLTMEGLVDAIKKLRAPAV